MPRILQLQLELLRLAEERIVRFEMQLTRLRADLQSQQANLESHHRRPRESRLHYFKETIQSAEQSLDVLYVHRAVILRTIEDIRAAA